MGEPEARTVVGPGAEEEALDRALITAAIDVSRAHIMLLASVQPLSGGARIDAEQALEQLESVVGRLRLLAVQAQIDARS